MNPFIFLFIVCNFSCVLFTGVELKFSDESASNDQDGVLRVSNELEPAVDSYTQSINQLRDFDDEVIVNLNDNDYAMMADEPPTDTADDSQVYSSTLSESSPTAEDIPTSTTSTETMINCDENHSTFVTTTEETVSEYSSTTDTTLGSSTTDSTQDGSATEYTSNLLQNETKTISIGKLSDQIRLVLQQYKKSGDVVLPNVPIPDPMHIPDSSNRISMVKVNFMNQTVHGLSEFTIQHVNTDLEKMQVYVEMHMKQLIILGNYSMSTFLSRASGPFNVTLVNVTTEGAAALQYTPDGNLEASETDMDMSFHDIKLDFKNLGVMGTFFQSIVGAAGTLVFEGIKPVILTEINSKMKDDVNKKIQTMSSGVKINSTMNPVDQAILEGRKYIKNQGYDPYYIKNYTLDIAGLMKVNISNLTVQGLSRFYRVDQVTLAMDNGTVEIGIHLAADKIVGQCRWVVGLLKTKVKVRESLSSFIVDHVQARVIIHQSLDLDIPPQLHDVDFLLGNIELRTPREDALDYIAEKVVGDLPFLLRHIIVDSLELPAKVAGQAILDKVEVKNIVDEHLPKLDELGV